MDPKQLTTIPRAYGNVLFVDHPWLGAMVLAATFGYPNIGISGLLGAAIGLLVVKLMQFNDNKSGLHIYNSLLVGLSLGAFYEMNLYVVILIALGAVVAVLLSVVMSDELWRLGRLPALSLPFIIVVLFTAPVAQKYSSLSDFLGLAEARHQLLTPWLDGFFSSLGSIFFSPQPWVGLLLFIAILLRSRYLALLALTGYGFGYMIFQLLTENPHPSLVVWTGFNFSLTAMAIGGFFTIPSLAGVVLALLAVAISALLVVATQSLLMVHGLPIMAVSFVLTTLIMLSALAKRHTLVRPWIAPQPDLPEINYERARLAQVRNGEFNSIPLLPPFLGEWEVYQGFDGQHTHQGLWRYALDFYMTEEGRSFKQRGIETRDYFCFGLPVVSPAYGRVVRAFDKLPDNTPGDVDVKNNWGNFVLLRLDSGLHVLLAHLRQHSLKVKEGDYVKPGDTLAACGNSGRSPQPHLHLQVQQDARLGSATQPFHLTSVVVRDKQDQLEYQLVARPQESESVQIAQLHEPLAAQLHLAVGRTLHYQFTCPNQQTSEIELRVELTLLGQFRLVSDSGASTAFEETNGVLAFYDRAGGKDNLLDTWLLANGVTPLTDRAQHWQDSPPACLLPLSLSQQAWLWLWRPLGAGINAHYQRRWDESRGIWQQCGQHQLRIGSYSMTANTESIFDPSLGCTDMKLQFGTQEWRATLVDTGQVADKGVPGWHRAGADNK